MGPNTKIAKTITHSRPYKDVVLSICAIFAEKPSIVISPQLEKIIDLELCYIFFNFFKFVEFVIIVTLNLLTNPTVLSQVLDLSQFQ